MNKIKRKNNTTKKANSTARQTPQKIDKRREAKNWRTIVESWVTYFEFALLRLALTALLIYEITLYVTMKFY